MSTPHSYGSFDYKVIDPRIKKILKARSELDNTIQVAMPFVKATTTVKMDEYLGDGNIGFTLGLHAIPEDVRYGNMYGNGGEGLYPYIGYTYKEDGGTERIYAKPPTVATEQIINFFAQGAELKNSSTFGRIPPPGITQAKIGRNKNGLLAYGEIDFVVPSLTQLEILHRVFLIPGCGMVLEWGQQFAPELNHSPGEFDVTAPITDYMFPWYNRTQLTEMLNKLAKRQVGMETILNKYVYPSQGQYMWMFGRIANFNTKANSDGSFNCNIKIVGPSEDAWAYSTRTTVLPAVDKSNEVCEATSIEQYFATTSPGKNLKTLLDNVKGGEVLKDWQDHVKFFKQGNKSEGTEGTESKEKKDQPNIDQTSFADSEDAYFFTWKFFVNVVINHEQFGIKSLYKETLGVDKLNKVSLLRPYADGPSQTSLIESPGSKIIDDPLESYVGRNIYLRSVDPSVMIIVHEEAANWANRDLAQNRPTDISTLTAPNEITDEWLKVGDFKESVSRATTDTDRGFLSCGVWLNHKAVVQSLVGADTFLRGVVNLLERMNSATVGFWQLTLDNLEPIDTNGEEIQSDNKHDYFVIDANWRGSSEDAVKKAIGIGNVDEPGLYVFNKYARTDPQTGKLVGSELIDSNVELKLPQLLFSQIATLGLVQKEDMVKTGIASGDPNEKSATISDPNEALREMFAITTLSVKSNGEQGPDLTILPYGQNLLQTCAKSNTQTTANTAGNSQRYGNQNTESLKNKDKDDLKTDLEKAEKFLRDNAELCNQCVQSSTQQSTLTQTTPSPVSPVIPTLSGNLQQAAAEFIAKEEGLPRGGKAYWDPAGQTQLVSIGYGHQIKENEYRQGYIQAGDERISIKGTRGIDTVMTNEQAKKLLQQDVPKYINSAKSPIGDTQWNKLSDTQKVALTSYAYNTGSTRSLVRAGLTDSLSRNDFNQATAIIRDKGIRTAGGKVLPALVNRRAKEASLFAQNISSTPPTPSPVVPPQTSPSAPSQTIPNEKCLECNNAKEISRQANKQLEMVTAKDKLMREFPHLQQVFRYIEPMPEIMVAKIRGNADSIQSNAFGASPGALSISAELVMPGINGIRVGELFWIDRIPTFYRAFGAFQVLSIEDTISLDGWKTQISSRFNYLGAKWKEATAQLLKK